MTLIDIIAAFLLLLLSETSNLDSSVTITTLGFQFKLDICFCNKYHIHLLCLVLLYEACKLDSFQTKLSWKMCSGSAPSSSKQQWVFNL